MTNMSRPTEPIGHQRNGLVSLHPKIYRLFMALAVLFVVAAWSFFGPGKYAGLVLVVVTLFFIFAIGVVADIAHVWHDHHDPREDPGAPTNTFHEWLRGDVRISRDTVSGKHAAIMASLPIAAVSIGMVLLAAVHFLTVG